MTTAGSAITAGVTQLARDVGALDQLPIDLEAAGHIGHLER